MRPRHDVHWRKRHPSYCRTFTLSESATAAHDCRTASAVLRISALCPSSATDTRCARHTPPGPGQGPPRCTQPPASAAQIIRRSAVTPLHDFHHDEDGFRDTLLGALCSAVDYITSSQSRPEMPAGGEEFFCEVPGEKLLAEEFKDNGWDLQFMG